jgi:hypothetical protein
MQQDELNLDEHSLIGENIELGKNTGRNLRDTNFNLS